MKLICENKNDNSQCFDNGKNWILHSWISGSMKTKEISKREFPDYDKELIQKCGFTEVKKIKGKLFFNGSCYECENKEICEHYVNKWCKGFFDEEWEDPCCTKNFGVLDEVGSIWDYYAPADIDFVEKMIKECGEYRGYSNLEDYRKNLDNFCEECAKDFFAKYEGEEYEQYDGFTTYKDWKRHFEKIGGAMHHSDYWSKL